MTTQQFGGQVPQSPSPVTPPAHSQESRLLAACAHLSFLVGFWFVAPIAIYVIKRKESRFVAFHAMQAAVLHLLFWVGSAVATGLVMVGSIILGVSFHANHGAEIAFSFVALSPFLIFGLGMMAILGIGAWAAYSAWEGNTWSIPIAGGIARRIIAHDDGAAKA